MSPERDARYTTVPGAIGTEGYMAPEQARGALPDPGQDLYSVGRVGLQLITGLPPERQGAIGSGPLRPLLERLLVVDPEQRFASADAALRLLRRLDIAFEDGPQVTDRLGCQPSAEPDWVAWAVLAGCAVVVALCVAVVVGVLL